MPAVKTKEDRAADCNQLLTVIGDCGRRFFYRGPGVNQPERRASFEIRHGRVYFIDEYSGRAIYTHYCGPWRGFSHGGKLRSLVDSLRCHIMDGRQVSPGHFGPWPQTLCGGDLWGYGADMEKVRAAAIALGITPGPTEAATVAWRHKAVLLDRQAPTEAQP